MKASQLMRATAICIYAGRPVFYWSEPGMGKSSVFKQVCESLDLHMLDRRCAQEDAVDSKGMPAVVNGRTIWALPSWLPSEPGSAIFFDEFPQASPLTMNAYSELILDGTLGGEDVYRLPPGTPIGAAGNRRSDRAATHELPSHLKNRFVHVEMEFDIEEFVSYHMDPHAVRDFGITKLPRSDTMHEAVLAFSRFRPNIVQKFDANQLSFPTARSVSFVSDLMPYLLKNDDLMFPLVAGCCGEGYAVEFTAFLRLITQLFDPDLVFRSPETAPIPKEPAIMYALITALASRVTKKTSGAMFVYLERLPQDYAIVCARDAMKRLPDLLKGSKEAMAWAVKNAKYLI